MDYFCPMPKKNQWFSKKLILWYLQNKRNLPWRQTSDPYHIWLSEVILQQTRVAQGLPYYERFVSTFPTIYDLANAQEAEILKLWQGLGYYSRARNLHATARYIAFERNGTFPDSYEGLLKLKGVGDYTASAIASICMELPCAVVDGNVYRVLSRMFGIETPVNSSAGIREFKKLAQELIDPQQPGTFNQAIMEFGARYCVPQHPNCQMCIFSAQCTAYRLGKVPQLPVKSAKVKIKKRYFNYVVVLSEDGRILLRQRTEKGIWHKLYEFPLVETTKPVDFKMLKTHLEYTEITEFLEIHSVTAYNEMPVVHKLSHQHLFTQFWIVECAALGKKGIPLEHITAYAVPVLIANFISEFQPFQN